MRACNLGRPPLKLPFANYVKAHHISHAAIGVGVLVAAVLPGSTDTDMLEGSGFTPKMTAEEVARVVRFLCTEAPLAMSGSLVEVFG